jgi:rhomboid protease GluP
VCPECPAATTNHAEQPAARALSFPITKVLIALNVAVFLAMVVIGHVSPIKPQPLQIETWGANFGPLTLGGQWWRLVSNVFIHIGIVHLALNMWCLWNVGALAEALFGEASYIVIYLLCGVAGSLASMAWHPMVPSAGASGAIFGIAGALIVVLKFGKLRTPAEVVGPILRSLVVFAIFNLAYGAKVAGVDNAAHLGGFVLGIVAGAVLILPALRGPEASGKRRVAAFVGVVAMVALALGVVRLVGFVPHLYAGERELEHGQPDKAIVELRKVTAARPDLAEAHLLLGRAYWQKRDANSAQARLLRATELDPKNAEGWSTLGRLYVQTGRLAQAADALQRVTTLQPNSPQAHFELANVHMAMQKPQPAVAELKQAVQLNPNFAAGWFELGAIALSQKDFATALPALENVVRLLPQSAQAHAALAAAYEGSGNSDKAAEQRAIAAKLVQQQNETRAPGASPKGDAQPAPR